MHHSNPLYSSQKSLESYFINVTFPVCSTHIVFICSHSVLYPFFHQLTPFLYRMAPEFNFIDDIVPGQIDWNLKVRVIHLWHVSNPKNQDDVNYLDMLLLDEKVYTFVVHIALYPIWLYIFLQTRF